MTGCPNCYDFGTAVLLTADFFNADGVTPADPTTVTLRILDPDGNESTPTPIKMEVGVYQYTLAALKAGVWWYRFEGAGGTVTAVMESNFVVASSQFADAAA